MVVAIMALLAVLGVPAFNEARARARDIRRMNDLRVIQQALEMFYSENGYYPSGDIGSNSIYGFCIERTLDVNGNCQAGSGKFCDLIKNYLPKLPKDPQFNYNNQNSPCYWYVTGSNSQSQSFKLAVYMEKNKTRASQDGGTNNNYYEICDQGFSGRFLSNYGLVGYWKFDEGAGTTTNDSSSYDNHGTLCNGATCPQQGPIWQASDCISNNCLSFDGVNDYVKILHSSSLNLTEQMTISFWVNVNSLPVGGWLVF